MKRSANLLMAACTVALASAMASALSGCAALAIEDSQVSLRKTSVFDVVTPAPFGFDGPGAAQTIAPLPGSGMPPMISHAVDEHLPLTAKSNECLECHDKPQNIGKPVPTGKARPASMSHYTQPGTPVLMRAQYNCMSCHAPQSDVAPLVHNLSR
jgi:cytochrome c-type protein NapB